jgi:hypothetical protein
VAVGWDEPETWVTHPSVYRVPHGKSVVEIIILRLTFHCNSGNTVFGFCLAKVRSDATAIPIMT